MVVRFIQLKITALAEHLLAYPGNKISVSTYTLSAHIVPFSLFPCTFVKP